ncbi:hypothetical protein PMIN06_003693 [Paraphaeosphaeria minitans]
MADSFPQRKVGGTSVSVLGLGCMGMSMSVLTGEKRDDQEIFNTLTTAADMGITLWDTSDFHLDNEDVLSSWFRKTGRRKNIFLATKFGYKHGPRGLGDVQISGSPETPIEKTVGALAELKQAGKIRHIGLSECSSRTLERACKVAKIDAVQMEFSPFAMRIEDTGFKDVARKLGVTISRADFGSNEPRPRMHPRFSEENFPENLKLVRIFEDIAKEKDSATGQVALA